jgi:hypothetical protein
MTIFNRVTESSGIHIEKPWKIRQIKSKNFLGRCKPVQRVPRCTYHADGRTDDEAKSPFRTFAKAPKNKKVKNTRTAMCGNTSGQECQGSKGSEKESELQESM